MIYMIMYISLIVLLIVNAIIGAILLRNNKIKIAQYESIIETSDEQLRSETQKLINHYNELLRERAVNLPRRRRRICEGLDIDTSDLRSTGGRL